VAASTDMWVTTILSCVDLVQVVAGGERESKIIGSHTLSQSTAVLNISTLSTLLDLQKSMKNKSEGNKIPTVSVYH